MSSRTSSITRMGEHDDTEIKIYVISQLRDILSDRVHQHSTNELIMLDSNEEFNHQRAAELLAAGADASAILMDAVKRYGIVS